MNEHVPTTECPFCDRIEREDYDEDAPPGEVLIDDTDWVPWRDLPRYAAKQKQAAEDAQREAKMHYLAREEYVAEHNPYRSADE